MHEVEMQGPIAATREPARMPLPGTDLKTNRL
jgi:hypothetical protein